MLGVAIVGAGLAGATAAATLRAEGYDGRLVELGAESLPPYERPSLSKEYLRGDETELHLVRPAAWYEEQQVDLLLGARVERPDPVADPEFDLRRLAPRERA